METFFVGVDISKDWLDACLLDGSTMETVDTRRVANTSRAAGELIGAYLRAAAGGNLWFCFEHTGRYGLSLALTLEGEGITYSAVPALEIIRSSGIVRGKSDPTDARRIALYAATHGKRLVPSRLPGRGLMEVKTLLAHRNLLARMSRQMQNARKALTAAGEAVDIEDLAADLTARIADMRKGIRAVEAKIAKLLEASEPLRENFAKATSVKGVGPIIAAYMMVYTDNFTSFGDPRKFNCYAGLAPFPHSSGSSIRGRDRTSPLRNRNMKALLFNGACSAAVHDTQMAAYYRRKREEGKHRMTVINAIACKLVYRVFAVVKRDTPYVNLSA